MKEIFFTKIINIFHEKIKEEDQNLSRIGMVTC